MTLQEIINAASAYQNEILYFFFMIPLLALIANFISTLINIFKSCHCPHLSKNVHMNHFYMKYSVSNMIVCNNICCHENSF